MLENLQELWVPVVDPKAEKPAIWLDDPAKSKKGKPATAEEGDGLSDGEWLSDDEPVGCLWAGSRVPEWQHAAAACLA